MIEKKVEVSVLYDYYQELLTKTQQNIIELYFNYDLSLTEIAEEIGISRQAVYDHIKRTEKLLFEYEEKLQMVQGDKGRREKIQELLKEMEELQHRDQDPMLHRAFEKIREQLEQL
ncbi:putative DNA-binding protein [Isachenkonia alkalipeptolytica]|uniref:UPF0122 protein ISALK_14465 n=1 Tax=Isachenkonia alkalipeptolytica TaxID=2565777 RepID=A0AA43XNE7_9CLOT|nr:putative DNA-binding protein [Isachenkonia alkalipeptolytica]NBG89686.1 putative DNA-binding protein [Isachenkonia alkalipeptolytica]